jgi:hypothetical protein
VLTGEDGKSIDAPLDSRMIVTPGSALERIRSASLSPTASPSATRYAPRSEEK